MTRRILKYCLGEIHSLPERREVMMPQAAKFLAYGVQRGEVVIWANVEDEFSEECRIFLCLGTGHGFPDDEKFQYLTTLLVDDRWVVHLFECV